MPRFHLTNAIATRERSLEFAFAGMVLPNPDPILKSQGKDITVYRDMRSDGLIGSCIRRRKSAVKALDSGLDRNASPSRVTKAVQAMLDELDLPRIIGQILDCTLYGYQPLEVNWQARGGLLVPTDVVAKPPEWFRFDTDNQLRFLTRDDPMLGELVPERKFLLARQDPTYQNPYGFPDLSMCFWPLAFKKGGLKFWLSFAEKFGSAFSIGKLPRNATETERAALLDSLDDLIQNGVATIPDDGSVELLEMAGKSASADLYERLVMHCRGEITIALLGQNQTTEASANRASATAGLEVTHELRDADGKLAAETVNTLIEWFCELNFGSAQVPQFSLWDQAAQDTLQAARDKSNHEAGANFTNAYWMRAYGYQEGDLQAATPATTPGNTPGSTPGTTSLAAPSKPAAANALGDDPTAPDASGQNKDGSTAAFAEGAAQADPTAPITSQLMQATAPQWTGFVQQLQSLVDDASDMATLQQNIVQAYGQLDAAELVKLMAAAMALAELKGIDAVLTERTAQG